MSVTATGRPPATLPGEAAAGRSGFPAAWRHRLSWLLVGATLFLIFVGGLVTSHGAGLSVPDWPLSYGMLMPPMVGNVFYEHGHRMLATGVGLLTLVLAVWTARSEPRPGLRLLAWSALASVIAQGVLGGLTVLYLLPTPVSVAHACLAQIFLCLVIALAYATSREWQAPPLQRRASQLGPAAGLLTGAVLAQLLLGAVMRHTGAGLAIPDFPRALGFWIPPLDTTPVAIHFAHRVGALVVLVCAVFAWRQAAGSRLRAHAGALVVLVSGQGVLGAATVLTAKAPLPTSLHVAAGAAILGLAWLLALRAHRQLPQPGTAPIATRSLTTSEA